MSDRVTIDHRLRSIAVDLWSSSSWESARFPITLSSQDWPAGRLGSLMSKILEMKNNAHEIYRVLKWLESHPSLESLQESYPRNWTTVENELAKAIESKDHARLNALMRPLEPLPISRRPKSNPSKREVQEIVGKLIRQRMSAIAIERFLKASLTDGKTRSVGWRDLFIYRRLFFTGDFRRKLVPAWAFRLLWPLVKQRNLLLPLAESHGIYCFYSRELVDELATLIGSGPCIEIAAGDGALTRFLKQAGVAISATDDHSWSGKVTYSNEVIKLDARRALKEFRPEVVICSWPPAKNSFEQFVFETESVQRYVVIGSRHKFASGNWPIYHSQKTFKMRMDVELSQLLLPPEFGGAVYVFDRAAPHSMHN